MFVSGHSRRVLFSRQDGPQRTVELCEGKWGVQVRGIFPDRLPAVLLLCDVCRYKYCSSSWRETRCLRW